MLGKTLILFFSLSKNIYSIYLEKHRSLNFDRLKKKKCPPAAPVKQEFSLRIGHGSIYARLNPPTFSSPVVFDPSALYVSPGLLKSKHVSTIAISRKGSYTPILALMITEQEISIEKQKKLPRSVIGINRNKPIYNLRSTRFRNDFFYHFSPANFNRVK